MPDHRPLIPAVENRTAWAARVRWWLTLVLLMAGCIATGLLAQSDAAQPILLELGKGIERQLAGGQSHEYDFTLQAGRYAKVLVDQRTINVAVAISGPDGKRLLVANNRRVGSKERAEWIAGTSGAYRLQVTSFDPTAPTGRYSITLSELETASGRHKSRAAAALAVARIGLRRPDPTGIA